jgi:predicted RNase H-like HicB family nuclease
MNRIYIGVIEAASDGYGIYFPDFPGCVSGGDDLLHTVAMGMEALRFHIETMVEDGEEIPEPREVDLNQERADLPEANLVELVAIPVAVPSLPNVVQVPIDTDLVREIDSMQLNRRAFFSDAGRREIERLKKSA